MKKLRTNKKRDTRNADLTNNNIFLANIATEAVLAKTPELETVCRDVRRQHDLANEFTPVPKNTNLATRQSLLFLRNSEDWYVYGTFFTVPRNFFCFI